MQHSRYCYLDETGNTGLNFRDKAQTHFIQGCVIARSNLDVTCADQIRTINQSIGVPELHGNELGIGKLVQIAPALVEFIETQNLEFVFTVIEKRHHLTLMLFHLFYDNGLNPAVSSHVQGVRALRMMLSLNFASLLSDEDLQLFWESTQKKSIPTFVGVLIQIQNKLRASTINPRSKGLLEDAITFTIQNPNEIFASMSFDGSASANLSAFSLMVNTLNQMFSGKNVLIEKFVHDRQDEFGQFLGSSFKTFANNMFASDALSIITDVAKTQIIKPPSLELKDSIDSVGLQIADIAVWLYKRYGFGDELAPVADLRNAVLSRTTHDFVSRYGHQTAVQSYIKQINALPIDDDGVNQGREMIRRLDANRWRSKE
jgi:hypothetical protein